MITTDKILIHKSDGKNLVLLRQVGSSYFLVLAEIKKHQHTVSGHNRQLGFFGRNSYPAINVLAEREVTKEEAFAIYTQIAQSVQEPVAASKEILLTSTKTSESAKSVIEKETPTPLVSPYFPTKEIFLSSQPTRAPAMVK